ncbi:MAG: glutamate formimidoyltransferase [Phototrophicaceae bacterium]
MTKVIECIANFSEGRNLAILDEIARAIASGGSDVLDVSSDADHHRTVITFSGDETTIVEGTVRGIQRAAELIDLTGHRGQHPRIGATDVVPFVPLRRATMEDCVKVAHAVGQRVGNELGIPVYLYEFAATRPERRNLADVRRGEYEALREKITQEQWMPDYGPASVGTAGAVAIGARNPLLAFNVYLDTTDVNIAKAIAKSIRESSGGLPYVKALGLFVNGRAQVSMNLVNFEVTGLFPVVEAIRQQATAYGVGIERSEVVGLLPQQAVQDALMDYLKLPREVGGWTIEQRLGQASGDYSPIRFE